MSENKMVNHPCFHREARGFVRMHLPIAPKCNISCKYCVRKYDCMNENRPGITSKVYTPDEAVELFVSKKRELGDRLSVVGISGPGDPLANWEPVREVFEKIRRCDSDILFCLSTNGLCLEEYIDELVGFQVSHVSVTINAFDAYIASKIYNPIDDNINWYTDFLEKQWAGVSAAIRAGIRCKINTVLIQGVNEHDAIKIAEKAQQYGCSTQNLISLIPVMGTCFDEKNIVPPEKLCTIRREAAQHIRQISHCRRCRADACEPI